MLDVLRDLVSDMCHVARAQTVNEMVSILIERDDDLVRAQERSHNDRAHEPTTNSTDAERREVGNLWKLVQRDDGASPAYACCERRRHSGHRRWTRTEHREPEVEPDDVGVGPCDGAIEGDADARAVPLPHTPDLEPSRHLAVGRAPSAVGEHGHVLDAPVTRELFDEERAVVGDAGDRRRERGHRADPHSSRLVGVRRLAATITTKTTTLATSATRPSAPESTLTGGEPRDSYRAMTDGTKAKAVTHASVMPSATAGASRSQAPPGSLNLRCNWRDRLHHDR